jgi:hypothetical protein
VGDKMKLAALEYSRPTALHLLIESTILATATYAKGCKRSDLSV